MKGDWVKLEQFRLDKDKRKIHKAYCNKCGHFFDSHRHMNRHIQTCVGFKNANRQYNMNLVMNDTNADKHITEFHKDLIEMFVSSNISINQINNYDFTKVFLHLGIKDIDIPRPAEFRELIIQYGKNIFNDNLKLFENKPVSLIFDGTTSWNSTYYQFALYFPGIVRHYTLENIEETAADNIRIIVNKICKDLLQKNIFVVGVTTDNASNLISCFKKIQNDAKIKKIDFPIIHFSCSAHTAQLLIDDLKKNSEIFSEYFKKIVKFMTWIRKKYVLKHFEKNGLNNHPPHYNSTRWNSLYTCIIYILNNFEFFNNIVPTIDKKIIVKKPCPIEFNETSFEILCNIQKVLQPIIEFTNNVQKNFYSAGDVYLNIVNLENEIDKLSESDEYGFVDIIQRNMVKRFDQNCDLILCQLGFLLTSEGRSWWKSRTAYYQSIFFKYLQNNDISEEERKFYDLYDLEKKLILNKIVELSQYLHFEDEEIQNRNSNEIIKEQIKLKVKDDIKKSFLGWLEQDDEYLENPFNYWQGNFNKNVIYKGINIFFYFSEKLKILITF